MTRKGARVLSTGLAIALSLGLSTHARATDEPREQAEDLRIAIDAPVYDVDIPEPDQEMLRERFESGMTAAGFEPTQGADQRVQASIGREEGDYRVRVLLVDGEVTTTVEEICELCGIEELGELLAAMGGLLRRKVDLSKESAWLRVETKPAGAQVRVDGEAVGTTPLEVMVTPGTHDLEVSKPGHRTERRSIDATAGMRDNYSFVMMHGGYQAWLPWTLLATGVVGIVAGGTLIGIDGREIRSDCNADPAGNCQFLHRTLGGGVALTVIGVGLVATGVALAIKWRRGPSAYARARPRFELAGAGFKGRF